MKAKTVKDLQTTTSDNQTGSTRNSSLTSYWEPKETYSTKLYRKQNQSAIHSEQETTTTSSSSRAKKAACVIHKLRSASLCDAQILFAKSPPHNHVSSMQSARKQLSLSANSSHYCIWTCLRAMTFLSVFTLERSSLTCTLKPTLQTEMFPTLEC